MLNKELEANQIISHYRIVSKIGAGGMGEVFLAEDTKLRRKIALKVLPESIANDKERLRRFEQEAFAASALNHPNILTIHEFGEENGVHFLAGEFVEGETLKERLKADELSLKETVGIAEQIAFALAAAHAAGIVHRDIKPENIMLRRDDRIVKVLDFGLAKLTEKKAKTSDTEAETRALVQTNPGVVMGTINYMSPEQARGKETDARTDIFSLGVCLYEMLTLRLPFQGETTSDVIAAILKSEPAPPGDFNSEIPSELERIVLKTLEKDREERYQTAKDLLVDLRHLKKQLEIGAEIERTKPPPKPVENAPENAVGILAARPASSAEYVFGEVKKRKFGFGSALLVLLAASVFSWWFFSNRAATTKQIESIAVLPFVNETGNADTEYLSDGMTETLISSLSQIPNLNVKARSSVFRYKGKDTDAQTIGKELNVQAILNGRVVQRGQDLILYVTLIDTATENVLWKADYNRQMTNLISLQNELAFDVSQKLKTKLSGADELKLAKNYTENAQAYQLYLKGRYFWNKRNKEDIYRAIEYYSQAVRVDPNYAIAYSGLADVYTILQGYDKMVSPLESQMKAREYALKALSLDDTLSEAHASNGLVLQSAEFDFAGAEREFKRAIELDPKNTVAYQYYALLLMCLARFDEAEANFRRALEQEPVSQNINRNYGSFLMIARRYDESEKQLRKTVELDPNFQVGYFSLSNTLQMQDKKAEAVEAYARAREVAGRPDEAAAMRASFKKGGWRGFVLDFDKSDWMLDNRPKYQDATRLASIGENQMALDALENSFAERESFMPMLKVDPRLDPLRSEPRFQDLLRRMNLQ